MAEAEESERTEEPTQQRREDFRKRGQVAHSKELASVFVILTGLLSLWGLGRFSLEQIHQVFSRSFSDYLVMGGRSDDIFTAVQFAATKAAMVVIPLAGVLWIINVLSSVVQTGFINNEEALNIDFNRLDFIEGAKKLFSLRAFVEGMKALLKMTLVGVIVYLIVSSEIKSIPHMANFDVNSLMVYIGQLVFKLMGWIAAFMLILASIDYLYQRWELEKKMRMTKQEIKEEIKSREGDPLIRARVRKLQRELANRRMMDDVKKADVIITNPTHIAVALQYTKEMIAPKLIAKGADEMAERIKKRAREFNIPIIENKPLARTIFKTMKLGQIIPRELYTAVAEVLSYIFKLKNKRTV